MFLVGEVDANVDVPMKVGVVLHHQPEIDVLEPHVVCVGEGVHADVVVDGLADLCM